MRAVVFLLNAALAIGIQAATSPVPELSDRVRYEWAGAHPLAPFEKSVSQIRAAAAADINGDGLMDLVVGDELAQAVAPAQLALERTVRLVATARLHDGLLAVKPLAFTLITQAGFTVRENVDAAVLVAKSKRIPGVFSPGMPMKFGRPAPVPMKTASPSSPVQRCWRS